MDGLYLMMLEVGLWPPHTHIHVCASIPHKHAHTLPYRKMNVL